MNETKVVVYETNYEVKCSLCGQKIQGTTPEEIKNQLASHIDNECKIATTIINWDKEGIYKPMMAILRLESLTKELEKLLKHYTIEEIKQALEMLEE